MEIDWSKVKVLKEVPPDAVRIHLYDHSNILRPRGRMKKESLSLHILERLKNCYESWSDPKYGDNPPIKDLKKIIESNLLQEVTDSLYMFNEWLGKRNKPNLKVIK